MSYSSNSVEKMKKKKPRFDDGDNYNNTKKKPNKKRKPRDD